MANPIEFGPLPPRFAELKKEIVASYPDFEARATKAWGEILADLDKVTRDIAAQGSAVSRIVVLDNVIRDTEAIVCSERTRSQLQRAQ